MSEESGYIEAAKIAIPIASATVTGFFGYVIAKRNAQRDRLEASSNAQDKFRDDLIRRVEKLESDNVGLHAEVQKLSIELSQVTRDYAIIEIERDNLKNEVENYEGRLFKWPFPSWVKRDDGFMIKVDDYYEEFFLKPHNKTKSDYEGHSDAEIHGIKRAEEYKKADHVVFRTGKKWIGVESFPKANGKTGKAPCAKWEVITGKGRRAIQGIMLVTIEDIYSD